MILWVLGFCVCLKEVEINIHCDCSNLNHTHLTSLFTCVQYEQVDSLLLGLDAFRALLNVHQRAEVELPGGDVAESLYSPAGNRPSILNALN